ncbi:MAG TPA: MFS transporter [Kofleriaceae bacterium]|nr:MFS transporter [Kofleriaceae bacterium]
MALGRALRHRNYRLFFAGQGTSLFGTWLTKFATVFMAYRLTGSAFMLGLVAFASHAPTPIFAPIAGVLVDRWNRRRVIILSQVAAGVQSATLAVFAFSDAMTVWHLMALGAVQGLINAFDMPARQVFLREMIDDPADLPNAIALNSAMVNIAKLGGPAAAAVVVALVGEAWCFAIDAASYVAVVASLFAMRVRPTAPRKNGHVLAELSSGLRYVRDTPVMRDLLVQLAIVNVLGGAYLQLLPAVAAEQVGHGPYTLGVLMASGGCGALVGALYLANRTSVDGLRPVMLRCRILLGAAMISLELATTTWLAAPLVFVIGMALMIQLAATNTLIQTIVEPALLGRMMSMYAIANTGGMPLGAFLEGMIASRVGAIHTLAGAGVLVVIAALALGRSESVAR